ncbi:MAG: hypothetical protein KJZ53_06520, partial [Anaerolineales bacterium]|nr:hypothetical protein [Anaerolineales bacterium]
GMTVLTQAHLDQRFHWRGWRGTYDEVMPYLRVAFNEALSIFANSLAPELRDSLLDVVRELCEPNLSLRGHPRDRHVAGNQFSMERYISKFNLLASNAEAGIKRPIYG